MAEQDKKGQRTRLSVCLRIIKEKNQAKSMVVSDITPVKMAVIEKSLGGDHSMC